MTQISVSLPEELLEKIDEAAAMQNRSRDELLSEAVISYLRERGHLHRWEDPAVLNAVATQERIARLGEGHESDVVQEIREMRESRR